MNDKKFTSHNLLHDRVQINQDNIDRISSGYEEFLRHFHEVFFWMGEFRLEDKITPLFKGQDEFQSVVQTRIYRYYDKHGNPTRCRIRFVYNSANKDGWVEWSKESRALLMQATAEKNRLPEKITEVANA